MAQRRWLGSPASSADGSPAPGRTEEILYRSAGPPPRRWVPSAGGCRPCRDRAGRVPDVCHVRGLVAKILPSADVGCVSTRVRQWTGSSATGRRGQGKGTLRPFAAGTPALMVSTSPSRCIVSTGSGVNSIGTVGLLTARGQRVYRLSTKDRILLLFAIALSPSSRSTCWRMS